MAYVVKRTTAAGTVSTALVESTRDPLGRPRQRLLANLHGEPDIPRALARLALHRAGLLPERKELAEGRATWKDGTPIDPVEASELLAHIDLQLAGLDRERAVLERHCTATAAELAAVAKVFEREVTDTMHEALGRLLYLSRDELKLKQVKAKLKRMRGR